ncbi:MAG TPA: VTT domain-containing protein [Bryobacteraceae bacterium]|jgi:membrane-associated protein|nr:VTT domain-containing protein [Bryobacteraceae bacterium]
MLHAFFEFLHTLSDPERLIQFLSTVVTGWTGYAVLFLVVFAETGLLVGFFFPGDSLLFTVGVVAGAGELNILAICALLICASILGDQSGYLLGYRTGPKIFRRPDSRLFKQEYVRQTQAFYERHGGKTLIYAKFVPIVRTFAPFMAGVGRMRYPRFVAFNIFGGLGWVISMTLAGYFLGGVPIIRRHFEKVVIVIVLISVLPMLLHAIRASRQPRVKEVVGSR